MNKKKKQMTTYFILFSLLLIGVGYAILQANLQINGTAKIQANTWDIHFDNIQVNSNSVSIGENDSAATIDSENNCKVDFEVTLSIPGDFYEFTIDVVNAGTIDGMIGTLNKTLKVNNEVVSTIPEYLDYSVTYADGMEILENHKLEAGVTETFKVRLEFKTDIEELPEAATITTSLVPQYLQADSSGIDRIPEADFTTDSWDAIVAAYNANKRTNLQTAMEEGTTREVQLDMNNDGTAETTAHVRIANLSTSAECSTTGFSQTACGFVLEFSDAITTTFMNSTANGTTIIGDGNVGGWPASSLYSYVNTDIYNALPSDLKSKIIETTVISGHGRNGGQSNFTSIDKLYLLSTHELFEDVDGDTSVGINCRDTGYYNTRQLDYYARLNVTTSNYSETIKKDLSGKISYWWLRSATVDDNHCFYIVYSQGMVSYNHANWNYGVSPAFRIAE